MSVSFAPINIPKTIKNASHMHVISTIQAYLVRYVYSQNQLVPSENLSEKTKLILELPVDFWLKNDKIIKL